jgi:secretion/DNA translocation related TadE-like protein
MVLVERSAAAGAADAAALAAADARVGLATGFPCEQAAVIAEANGATLTSCEVDGLVVTVSVSRPVAGFHVTASATAGPPSSQVD